MNSTSKSRFCAFCGLPLPVSLSFARGQSATEADYCCSGCRTVSSVDDAHREEGDAARGLLRLGLAIFFTMNVMVFTMALWSQDVYPAQSFENSLAISLRGVFRWASLIFSLPVLWLLGGPIVQGVWQAVRRGSLTTDLLIVLGVGAAYCYSLISVLRGAGHVYFEVGAMVLVFVSIGRWMEAKGKRRTGLALDALANLLPATVRRLDDDGTFQEVLREEIKTGDTLRVLPGERLPVDGLITAGEANIDEQMLTGESHSTEKAAGDPVFSGTLNLDGDLRIEVTATDGQETLSRLVDLVRTARSTKGRHEQLADRIAKWFIPAVCLIAVVAGVYRGQIDGLDQGILTALAVVLIACPCALGLATPMAVWTALGRAASFGVLFRSGLVMERLASVRAACFDKTGTLTSGTPKVGTLLVSDPEDRDSVLSAAVAMAAGSIHPLSQAIYRFAAQHLNTEQLSDFSTVEDIPGKGLCSDLPNMGTVWFGSRRLMHDAQLHWSTELTSPLADQKPAQQVFIGWGGQVRGTFCLVEEVRAETTEALSACRELGLELQLLTGDGASRAAVLGQQFNLPAVSDQLPQDKVAVVRSLAKCGGVAMVGDGLNDAPALAAADVGVALGCGADVSRDAAGVCLLANDLRRFPWAVGLARTTGRIVNQNLFWSFSYNGIGIALAATGSLNPIWAALAMAVSSLLVVTNSLRLSRYPEPPSTISDKPIDLSGRLFPSHEKINSAMPSANELVASTS